MKGETIPATPANNRPNAAQTEEERTLKRGAQGKGADPTRAKALRAGLRLRVRPPKVQRPKTQPTRAQRKEALRRESPDWGETER